MLDTKLLTSHLLTSQLLASLLLTSLGHQPQIGAVHEVALDCCRTPGHCMTCLDVLSGSWALLNAN